MNTLRILKGGDLTISVDDTVVCFVTRFVAQEVSDNYEIRQMLSDHALDYVNEKEHYEINITALTHLSSKVFQKEGFTLSVEDGTQRYEYLNCHLKKRVRVADKGNPIVDEYTMIATDMRVSEVVYE